MEYFSVYLPNEYDDSDQRYPFLYLLHPAGGTHEMWISMGELPQIADDSIRSGMALPMIIVMPDASGEADYLPHYFSISSPSISLNKRLYLN